MQRGTDAINRKLPGKRLQLPAINTFNAWDVVTGLIKSFSPGPTHVCVLLL